MSVNKVILIGYLGRDPELRYMQNGTPVATLNLATSRKWRNKQNNELVEETEWHRVSVFGAMGEHCNNYLAKGRQVYIEGRLRTRSYEDKDGVKKYATEIIADAVQFLGGGKQGQEGNQSGAGNQSGGERQQGRSRQQRPAQGSRQQQTQQQPRQQKSPQEPEPYDPGSYPNSGSGYDPDDDIPF